jgi:hypothetical protein
VIVPSQTRCHNSYVMVLDLLKIDSGTDIWEHEQNRSCPVSALYLTHQLHWYSKRATFTFTRTLMRTYNYLSNLVFLGFSVPANPVLKNLTVGACPYVLLLFFSVWKHFSCGLLADLHDTVIFHWIRCAGYYIYVLTIFLSKKSYALYLMFKFIMN